MIKVRVYFESPHIFNSYCDEVAVFESEEHYGICVPALEKYAEENDMILTESLIEETELSEMAPELLEIVKEYLKAETPLGRARVHKMAKKVIKKVRG